MTYSSDPHLKGRRCVVTGAASGIGKAVAQQLIAAGATVVSLDRNPPTVEVEQHIALDLADPGSIDLAVQRLGTDWDTLINVAGLPGTKERELVFKVNFLGLRHLTEAMFGSLNSGGSVVNVSSTAGYRWPERLDTLRDLLTTETFNDGLGWFRDNEPAGNAYDFSKEAVTVYTMAMSVGMLELGLRMNAVLPGPVETPILADFEESMGKENLDGVKLLLGRHGEPHDIAPAVLFLASPVSGWVNGACLVADGGITAAVLSGLVPAPID